MRYLTYQRLATAGATAVTMLALAAGAAAADGVRPDDRAMHGPGAIAVAVTQRDNVVRPDDRADRRLAGVAVARAASGHGRLRLGRRGSRRARHIRPCPAGGGRRGRRATAEAAARVGDRRGAEARVAR